MALLALGAVFVLCGVTAKRSVAMRFGRSANLPAVVRGSGLGLYAEPMPGTVHVRGYGVWWVAEGTREPASLQGRADPDPLTDAPVPRELTYGVMRSPTTIRAHLYAGGYADVTVRRASVQQILLALARGPAVGGPPSRAPRQRARAPIGRLAVPCLGVALLLGLGSADPQTTLASIVRLVAYMLGFGGLHHVLGILRRRRDLVRANRGSRITSLATREPDDDAAADRAKAADEDDPLAVPLTYESMRAALAARSAAEEWSSGGRDDPHSWPRGLRHTVLDLLGAFAIFSLVLACVVGTLALQVVKPPLTVGAVLRWALIGYLVLVLASVVNSVLFLIRARRVAKRVPGVSARYLLARARGWLDSDSLIIFPRSGDIGPIGVIGLELPSAGAIPLNGMVWLAGPTDPATGWPADGALIVPSLGTGPLWPAGHYSVADADSMRALIAGQITPPAPEPTSAGVHDRQPDVVPQLSVPLPVPDRPASEPGPAEGWLS